MLKTLQNMHKSNKLLLILLIMFGVIYGGKVIYKWNERNNTSFDITENTLTYDNLPKNFNGYKILQLSDLHSKEFGENNKDIITAVKKINPDVIMVTGDMFSVTDIKIYSDETKLVPYKLLIELANDYKIIYVTGNHEEGKDIIYNGEEWNERNRNEKNSFNRYLKGLSKAGVIFVNNDKYKLIKGNESINVYGIYYSSWENKDNYYKKLSGDKNNFNIMLSHSPVAFDDFSNRNFNLMLSGHVHGGVIRLPIIGGVLDPERKLFPKYNKGIYEKSSNYMNVSVGLGDASIKRFNNKPEINIIVLNKK